MNDRGVATPRRSGLFSIGFGNSSGVINASAAAGSVANAYSPGGSVANAYSPGGSVANAYSPGGSVANAYSPGGSVANAYVPTGSVANAYQPPRRSISQSSINDAEASAPTQPFREPPFTKEDYSAIVKHHRQEFVYEHFGGVISDLMRSLKEDASRMRQCHREVVFEVPDHFDIDRMEGLLCAYFTDIGYKPLTEPRAAKDTGAVAKILITLT